MAKKKSIDKTKFEELVDQGKSKREICTIFSVGDNKMTSWIYENYKCTFSELANTRIGRPHKVIDKLQFEDMCRLQCTEEEILLLLRVDKNTLWKWCERTYNVAFSQVYHTYAEEGKMSLRRAQQRLAETNPQMAIWLGKQMLGQRDVVEQDIRATVNETQQQLIDKLAGRINLEEEESPTDEQSTDNQ